MFFLSGGSTRPSTSNSALPPPEGTEDAVESFGSAALAAQRSSAQPLVSKFRILNGGFYRQVFFPDHANANSPAPVTQIKSQLLS